MFATRFHRFPLPGALNPPHPRSLPYRRTNSGHTRTTTTPTATHRPHHTTHLHTTVIKRPRENTHKNAQPPCLLWALDAHCTTLRHMPPLPATHANWSLPPLLSNTWERERWERRHREECMRERWEREVGEKASRGISEERCWHISPSSNECRRKERGEREQRGTMNDEGGTDGHGPPC